MKQVPISTKGTMIRVKALSRICDLPISAFGQYGDRVETSDGVYYYRDRGAKILGVAHLDTVQNPTPLRQKGEVVWHPCLDDRLGAYLLLEVLPQLGIEFDLLLTEGEEVGRSTAAYFPKNKQYNWMFSFDRAGMDVVMYQYQDQLLERMVEHHNLTVGLGSFSDICFLEHLGCKGLNFGTGYYDNHLPDAHAILTHTAWMVSRFAEFYNACKDTQLLHEHQPSKAEQRLDRLLYEEYLW